MAISRERLEQHKRLQELESEICLVRNTKINTNKMECIHLQAEILELKEELSLTKIALKLACETIKSMCPKPLWIGGTIPSPEVKDVEYFKEIAKEIMKSE